MPVDSHTSLSLKGQRALVTGAGSGIGQGIAVALARAGADVAVNYPVDRKRAVEVVEEIERAGGRAIAVRADVRREVEVEDMFSEVVETLGGLDILVSNASIQRDAPFEEMTLADWRDVIDINLTGQFLCAREAVREFRRRGRVQGLSTAAGKIICVSSVHETIPWAGHVNYAASKGGVMLMMKSLAQEVARFGIRVNSIAPGAIRTPTNRAAWETPEAQDSLLRLIPLGRIGEVDDIGRAAVWLASDASDYVHGMTLAVDGGMLLYPGFESAG